MKLSICTDIQTIDVIVAILTISDKVDLKPKFRKFLNRAETGLEAKLSRGLNW